jgi:hypothetical protein
MEPRQLEFFLQVAETLLWVQMPEKVLRVALGDFVPKSGMSLEALLTAPPEKGTPTLENFLTALRSALT